MQLRGLELSAAHEWLAHDPFGRPKPADVPAVGAAITDAQGRVTLRAARNGYVSFRLLVRGRGEFRLSASATGGLEADLYKAWFHRMHAEAGQQPDWWPDALVPVNPTALHRLPDPDNRIKGQNTQEFWVDIFVPPDAEPGVHTVLLRLAARGREAALAARVEVLDHTIPDEPRVTMDYNSYGCRWLADLYPNTLARARSEKRAWHARIELLHHYHRIVREHCGLFHNLGYGHSGAFDPIYGPRIEGRGRTLQLTAWDRFDRHYGPLLDGRAFAQAAPALPPPRRAPAPIWGVYTPINPDWPASYLWWGQQGYEVEFTRGVAQFDHHLRQNGWTSSFIELFFNHKKRYRWFEWDGDEPKHLKDLAYHQEMIRLWEAATAGSPVKWVYRSDASWQMKNQFQLLGGHRNFWVCGGFVKWFSAELARVLARGEIVWWYNGTPPVQAPSSAILALVYETWGRRMHGNCQWLTVQPGPDPWFDCDGASTGAIYPGERFGIPGPIPSIRAKVLRNGIQDIDLLHHDAQAREELTPRVPIPLWQTPPRAARELPPEDWDSYNLSAEHEPVPQENAALDPFWWQPIRDRALASEDRP